MWGESEFQRYTVKLGCSLFNRNSQELLAEEAQTAGLLGGRGCSEDWGRVRRGQEEDTSYDNQHGGPLEEFNSVCEQAEERNSELKGN